MKKAIIDPLCLREDERKYELDIREIPFTGNPEEQKEQLLEHAHAPVNDHVLDALEPEVEWETMRPKVMEMEVIVREALLVGEVPQRNRLESLYVHLVHRMRRIMFRARGEVYDALMQLAERINALQPKLFTWYPDLIFPALYVDDSSVQQQLENLKVSKKDDKKSERGDKKKEKKEKKKSRRSPPPPPSGSSSSSSSESSSEEEEDEAKAKSKRSKKKKKSHEREERRTNPVTKWTFRYSGGKDDLAAFLDDVEESMKTHSVSDKEMLVGFGSLLKRLAKTWYRRLGKDFETWKECKKALWQTFEPEKDDDEVIEKIKALRQSKEETFPVYEARMEDLFIRLRDPPSEKKKVKWLMGGLQLFSTLDSRR